MIKPENFSAWRVQFIFVSCIDGLIIDLSESLWGCRILKALTDSYTFSSRDPLYLSVLYGSVEFLTSLALN